MTGRRERISATIIRSGRVIDPANNRDEIVDLAIVDGLYDHGGSKVARDLGTQGVQRIGRADREAAGAGADDEGQRGRAPHPGPLP